MPPRAAFSTATQYGTGVFMQHRLDYYEASPAARMAVGFRRAPF